MGESAFAAPPEDAGGAYGGGREAEHFGLSAVKPGKGLGAGSRWKGNDVPVGVGPVIEGSASEAICSVNVLTN